MIWADATRILCVSKIVLELEQKSLCFPSLEKIMDQIPYFRRAVATLINFKVILKLICNDFLKVNI